MPTARQVATAPLEAGIVGRRLIDVLGPTQPLTTFGAAAGVLEIPLADGSLAYGAVRSLFASNGELAIVHGRAEALAAWAVRHRADGHALRHHRLRRADPRLRLPLAGDPRARGRRDLRDGPLAHRYRAQPRPLRIVGLGSRTRPRVLVAFHVRDLRPQAARRAVELRRGQCPRPPRGYRSLRARRPARRRQGDPRRSRLPHAPCQRQLGVAARPLRAGPAVRRRRAASDRHRRRHH